MYYVEYRDTDTGETHRFEHRDELVVAQRIGQVELHINTELIEHNVDLSKFRR